MKIVDQIYHCQISGQGSHDWRFPCHLQIFQSRNGVQTVMVSEMGFEMGWFHPCVVEALATQIVTEFQLDPTRLVWLECYTESPHQSDYSDFSQVTFDWHNGQATNPQWQTVPRPAQVFSSEALLSA